jgi:hypothetical protein
MAKKKITKKKGAKKNAAKKKAAAMGRSGGVDLADVLRREGVDEQRIPDVLAIIRSLSDAQADENSAPSAPTPTPLDSTAGLTVAASADALVEERERWRARTRQAIHSGLASDMSGRQNTLWVLEPRVLRGPPRASFVGRALHVRSVGSRRSVSCEGVCDAIYGNNPLLLSNTLRQAVEITRNGPIGATQPERRRQATGASSAIKKRTTERVELLATELLRYAESLEAEKGEEHRLTRVGRRVFDNWPNWHHPDANPWVEDEPPTADAGTPTDIS